jgi:hypothetical protein
MSRILRVALPQFLESVGIFRTVANAYVQSAMALRKGATRPRLDHLFR